MAKDLPYFKFNVSEWLSGDITECSLSAQGLFTNICALYWSKSGKLSYSKMNKKFPRKQKYFTELLDDGIIKLNGDNIEINFLTEQLEERGSVSEQNTNNAKEGWKRRKSDATALQTHSESHISGNGFAYIEEEKREEESKEEKKRGEKPAAHAVLAVGNPFVENTPVSRAWSEWIQYRKEKKQKLTPSTAKKQIQFLGGRGDPEIVAIIEQSIKNGWTGLFEIKNNQKNGFRTRNQRTADAVIEGGNDFGEL